MKQIYLGKGKNAQVSDEDFDLCGKYDWHLNNGYARTTSKGIRRYLHQMIAERMGLGMVDHEDQNKLNCQRFNLRPATYSQNGANSKSKGSKYGKGIDYHQDRYRARIKVNYRTINLDCFLTLEEATAAYINAAREHFGEFANAGD